MINIKKIIVIDDHVENLNGWKDLYSKNKNVALDLYLEPEAFFEHYAYGPLKKLNPLTDVIIMDYMFGEYTAGDQEAVSYIREDMGFKGSLFIWTNLEEFEIPDLIKAQAVVIPKKLLSLEELKNECK